MRTLWIRSTVFLVLFITAAFLSCGEKEETGEVESEFEEYDETSAGEPKAEGEAAIVTAGPLNLRARPSLGGAVVRRLDMGETLVVLDRSDEQETVENVTDYWYEVRTADGDEGWVFGSYITLGGEVPSPGESPGRETRSPGRETRLPGRAKEVSIDIATADEPGWTAADYFNEGKSLHDAARYDEALPYLKKAVELEPEKGDYHFYLAYSLQELGRNAEAASEYEECVTRKPDDFWAHNNLGLACIYSGQPARAVEALEKAITFDPKGTADKERALDIARRNLATAYEMNGQPARAREIRDKFNL